MGGWLILSWKVRCESGIFRVSCSKVGAATAAAAGNDGFICMARRSGIESISCSLVVWFSDDDGLWLDD